MKALTFAEFMEFASLMLAGLRDHVAELTGRGIDETFTNELETQNNEIHILDAEQEKLKAEQITKTAELNAKRQQMEKKLSEAKTLVKLAIEKSHWLEFGIKDKR